MNSISETECLVFSTSLQTPEDLKRISGLINNQPGITDWSVDLEDWEKVLRLEGTNIETEKLISALRSEGVFIRQMEM